jgi:hypothetical protein
MNHKTINKLLSGMLLMVLILTNEWNEVVSDRGAGAVKLMNGTNTGNNHIDLSRMTEQVMILIQNHNASSSPPECSMKSSDFWLLHPHGARWNNLSVCNDRC